MSFDETQIGRAPHNQPRAPRDDVRWVIPPLVGRGEFASASSPGLPLGYRLGEHVVAEARGQDGPCEMVVVTHAERGSLHMARVVRREHAALAPAMLAVARELQRHPQRNLLTILETGWTDEASPRAFVVHERLVGRSLASLLAGRGVEWPMVMDCATENGWLYSNPFDTILLCGTACEALKQAGDADIEYYCNPG